MRKPDEVFLWYTPNMKPKISIITLGVSDFHKSFEFYTVGLGFTPHNYKPGETYVMYKMEGTWFSLFPIQQMSEDAGVPRKISALSSITLAHNVESEEKVNEVFAQALQAGATSIKTPQKASWGGYAGYFADPDGYLWEVAYNPFTDLT